MAQTFLGKTALKHPVTALDLSDTTTAGWIQIQLSSI
jgi:hypothetical protein